MNEDERHILFLDIETVACVSDYDQLSERLKKQWERKASFLRREEGETDAELFNQRAGIYAEFGKIVAIVVGGFKENDHKVVGLRTKILANHDEHQLLSDFRALLEKADRRVKLCAHNGKEFDFPYLCRRMLVHSIPLPNVLDMAGKKPWEIPHLDTLEMWKFGDYKHYTSLDLLATLFEIPSSKSTIDGSMVNSTYYQEKDLDLIARYCKDDVVVLAQLYRRLKGFPLIDEQLIVEA